MARSVLAYLLQLLLLTMIIMKIGNDCDDSNNDLNYRNN